MRNAQIKNYLLLAIWAIVIISCSDLEIEETDRIIDRSTTEGGIFNGVESVPASLDNIFNRLGPSWLGLAIIMAYKR